MKHMNGMARCLWAIGVAAAVLVTGTHAKACIWDADTLVDERRGSPAMADVILNKEAPKPDVQALQERIARLKAAPREDDPAWWNDLAGAHIRLGQPQEAVKLLEPAVRRFPDDYGVHANLGTAYHLLGRYQEAEREIARDLEINPEAHFGLERYHLALLQYLVRDREYQSRHVYIDEWTEAFLQRGIWLGTPDGKLDLKDAKRKRAERVKRLRESTGADSTLEGKQWMTRLIRMLEDSPPPYRYRWDLASDPKFEEGIRYMASLNRTQPACFTMLGVACLKKRDLNLAAAAFQRAIDLGSPQAELLQQRISSIHEHIYEAHKHERPLRITLNVALVTVTVLSALVLIWRIRTLLRRRAKQEF
jgi:TPR repeat protein